MSDVPATTRRALLPAEKKALGLIQMFEKAVKDKRLMVKILAGPQAAELVARLDGSAFKLMKVEFQTKSSADEPKYEVAFRLSEFRKYVLFILAQCHMVWEIDGTVTTYDKLTISNEYLGDESPGRTR